MHYNRMLTGEIFGGDNGDPRRTRVLYTDLSVLSACVSKKTSEQVNARIYSLPDICKRCKK